MGHEPHEHTHFDWTELPHEHGDTAGWAHHGVAVTRSGHVVTFGASGDEVMIYDGDGVLVDSWPTGLGEGHDITTVLDGDGEYIWIADPGSKMQPTAPGVYEGVTRGDHGRVVKFDLSGQLISELPVPPHPNYVEHRYSPTAVVVDATSLGGDGRIYVADGYGQSLVHVFDADGTYLQTLDGDLNCPHALLIDRRRDEPELYVVDRENGRLQVYGLDGVFRRTVGAGVLRRPAAIAVSGDRLYVAELEARLAILDADDELLDYVGADDVASGRPGWPNAVAADGRTVRPDLTVGLFNSPHGLAVNAHGDPIVAEWLIGGRVNTLTEK
jgi:DNA-binding beta-propeller fold protein YncE